MVPTTLLVDGNPRHPSVSARGVGSKPPLPLCADVRLHIPMTHNDYTTGQDAYTAEHEHRLTAASRVYFAQRGIESWVGTWLGLIGSLVVLFTALFLAIDPDAVDNGLAGMALSYVRQY